MEEKIGDILRRIFKETGREHLYFEGILKNKWHSIVGEFLGKITTPERIYNDTLYIKCNNSAVKQEIFFLKNKILNNVNEFFNKKIIEDIKVFFQWK